MSDLEALTERYLQTRRALGYALEREGKELPRFARFVVASGQEHVSVAIALEWAGRTPSGSAQQTGRRMGWIRQLARYLLAYDPRTEVPAPTLAARAGSGRHVPHIFRADEILALMHACKRYQGLKARTMATLIGLLAATGLRIGEALALDRRDVDGVGHRLTVRSGKFGKARRLPLSTTTSRALTRYALERDRALPAPASEALLLTLAGTRVSYRDAHRQFHTLVDLVGLGIRTPRPRPHDLRHTFAVETLRRWYADDRDIEPRLAVLSTYLGHVSPASTYWYLTATPELLALARERAERRSGRGA